MWLGAWCGWLGRREQIHLAHPRAVVLWFLLVVPTLVVLAVGSTLRAVTASSPASSSLGSFGIAANSNNTTAARALLYSGGVGGAGHGALFSCFVGDVLEFDGGGGSLHLSDFDLASLSVFDSPTHFPASSSFLDTSFPAADDDDVCLSSSKPPRDTTTTSSTTMILEDDNLGGGGNSSERTNFSSSFSASSVCYVL